jgi:hypothetical protein
VFTFFAGEDLHRRRRRRRSKEIIRTYNFTAQYNGSGGSGTDSQQTICQVQDSQAA